MADNTILPGTGETYASDDIGSVKYQRVKLSIGVPGEANDCSDVVPLPVANPALNIDGATNSLQTISHSHHEIHAGKHYVYRSYNEILKDGTKEILIVTPDTPTWGHVTIGFEITNSTTVAELFEGVTTSNDGAVALTRNRDRNVADNNTLLVYEDPTISGGDVAGNLLMSGIFGSGRNSLGGGARDTEELILKAGTKYLLRFTEQNIEAANVNYLIDWYEHANL